MTLECKICHGNGNNGADDASCLSCGGTGEEQRYSLKDFCIEFKDAVNKDPEMESGLRQLVDSTHQATVEEIIKIAEGIDFFAWDENTQRMIKNKLIEAIKK
jgi:RecJ-like exonuclease